MIVPTLALSAAMFAGLFGIYGAMQSHWPASYVNITTTSGQLGRFSLLWFLIFRSAPTFMVASVASVSAERLGLSPSCTVILGLVLYAIYALHHSIRGPLGMSSRGKVVFVGCIGISLSIISGLLALWFGDRLAALIPEPSALLDAIWTAAFVAVMYAASKRLLSAKVTRESLYVRAKRDIGAKAWEFSQEGADRYNVSILAVRAVLLAEAIQRPRWFRFLERLLQCVRGLFRDEGTTGIAQVRSRWPVSDEASVESLCADMQAWASEKGEIGGVKSVEKYARHRNDDDIFVESVAEQYTLLSRQ